MASRRALVPTPAFAEALPPIWGLSTSRKAWYFPRPYLSEGGFNESPPHRRPGRLGRLARARRIRDRRPRASAGTGGRKAFAWFGQAPRRAPGARTTKRLYVGLVRGRALRRACRHSRRRGRSARNDVLPVRLHAAESSRRLQV